MRNGLEVLRGAGGGPAQRGGQHAVADAAALVESAELVEVADGWAAFMLGAEAHLIGNLDGAI
jgi:hypothetical protein